MKSDLNVGINLFADGDRFFDMLKAVIREWQVAPWPHERERATYAMGVYQRSLNVYRDYLESAKNKSENGFNTELDKRLVQDMEKKLSYWEKKLEDVSSR